MGMSMGMYQRQSLVQMLVIPCEVSGELALFSLHRIRHRIPTMKVHDKVKDKLIAELVKENSKYRKETKKNWFCITPYGLDTSVDRTEDYLVGQVNLGLATLDDPKVRQAFQNVMTRQAENQVGVIKGWFSDNYDALLYDMNGKIPFPIVRKMREKLAQWAIEKTNPFQQSLTDLIEESVVSLGLNPKSYESAEEMWKELKRYK